MASMRPVVSSFCQTLPRAGGTRDADADGQQRNGGGGDGEHGGLVLPEMQEDVICRT